MTRNSLVAFNKQVAQLPPELQTRECGLIEVGRQHARDFDGGHCSSGSGVQRVLTELRKLAARLTSDAPVVHSELDELRARRTGRLTDAAGPGVTSA